MTKISVIVPTTGRATLLRTLKSCADADEIVIVADGRQAANAVPRCLPRTRIEVIPDGPTQDHGYTARTRGMRVATGTHLAFLDDDDIYTAGTLNLMRQAACDYPVIFRMSHPQHGVLWRLPRLEFGNVGTPMLLVPNMKDKLGRWAPHMPALAEPGGDYTFIQGCCEAMGDPVWRHEVIAHVRPTTRTQTVAVVTPWHNHADLAPDFFAALKRGPVPDELVIVDNGSSPPLEFADARLERNRGFSQACNLGLEIADASVVLFLNNDIAAGNKDWLNALADDADPGTLVGASLCYGKHADVGGQQFPYLDGWCMGGMREDLLALGGFDEDYEEPAYYSDNDLCLRARANGMTLREVPTGLRHKRNVTSHDNPTVIPQVTERNYERYARLARKLMTTAQAA